MMCALSQGEHVLDDKSTAQARVQMQIVSQLELQLQKVQQNRETKPGDRVREREGKQDRENGKKVQTKVIYVHIERKSKSKIRGGERKIERESEKVDQKMKKDREGRVIGWQSGWMVGKCWFVCYVWVGILVVLSNIQYTLYSTLVQFMQHSTEPLFNTEKHYGIDFAKMFCP